MKKAMALVLSLIMVFSMVSLASAEEAKTYTIGICNLVDDASLNQIIQNIRERLAEISEEKGVQFEILEQNCNLDASVRQQIIENYIADEVDLLVGVATPVAQTMQGMTEESKIPVVFAAGEVCGGVHGGTRLGGNAVADIVIFGRIAAETAMQYIGK